MRRRKDQRPNAYRELTGPLLLADKEPEKYDRAAFRWHVGFLQETKNVDLRESQAVLALLAPIPLESAARARASLRDTCRVGG